MALGNRGRSLLWLIFVENTLLGLFGCIAGAVIGVLCAKAISAIGIPMPPPPNMSSGYTALIRVVPSVIVMSMVIGYVAALLASFFAARRVIRLPIIEALRYSI